MRKNIQPLFMMFVVLLVSLQLSGCASLVVGSGGNGNHDPRTQVERQADAEITRQINRAFVKEADIPAVDIRVTTFRGVATLAGQGVDRQVQQRAIAMAKQVAGVRRVRADFR